MVRSASCHGRVLRHVHLLQPGLAALPAEADQEVGGGGERVGHAVDQIAAAVAVEVDGVLEIVGGGELHAAELAGPVADHAVDGLVAALDDAQRVEQLRAEEIGPAAVIGECGDGAENLVVAEIAAEVALQAPEGGEHRRRHAVFLFHLGEQLGVLLDLGEPVGDAAAANHAVGKLQEGLVEHRLAVVAAHDGRVEGHRRGRFGDHARRDALGGGFFLEILEPAFVGTGVAAARGQGRARQAGAERHDRQSQCRHPHRLIRLFRGLRGQICPMPRKGQGPILGSVKGAG